MLRSLFRRPRAVRIPADGGTVGLRRVEVTQRTSSPSMVVGRFALNAVLFYCAFHTVKLWINGPDPEMQKRLDGLRKEREAAKNKPTQSDHLKPEPCQSSKVKNDKASDSSEESGETTIIPIYGWLKQLDKQAYSETDPEWKAFVTLQHDERATQKLYREFDAAITKQVQHSNTHLKNLAYIRYTGRIGRDLSLQLMLSRPPRYAMRCLVIKPSGVSLGWKELEHVDGTRMQRLRQPVVLGKAFAKGVWAFSTTTTAITRAKVMDIVYPERTWTYNFQYIHWKGHNVLAKITGQSGLTHEQEVITKLPSAQYSDELTKRRFPFLQGSLTKESPNNALRSAVQTITHEHALQHSIDMFKREWVKGQLEAQQYSTPGAVNIVGHYDWKGEKGKYRVEVSGWYLPREDAFIGPPIIKRAYVLHDFAKVKVENRLPSLVTSAQQPSNPHQEPSSHSPGKRPESAPVPSEKEPATGKETGK
ncbi:uncharacterized protein HMPREF1541_10589 [Cyphellophora europaea CBS 101466]|uniref:Uncharacterized protein n=1 Tax=Cyphellophora europaea (strain CBS 101466) TaxID=1220924 RepID=W2S937_CYPE1|nr:uncharacterized protein HMPREF1541_10589 [Cyphellophora europaea CBS 101466]ETN44409.1 hypothetical protein HMPREF1541_10589 [Cyphellophora europaea CBS 101466]